MAYKLPSVKQCACAMSSLFQGQRYMSGRPGGVAPMVQYPSSPLPQRLEGNDTIPADAQPGQPKPIQFQTFWAGNQLPGITTLPASTHTAWIPVRGQDQTTVQRQGGAFGRVEGVLNTSRLLARWHELWTNQQS